MYKKIMVPLDGSQLAECVLPHVEVFATRGDVELIYFVRVTESVLVHYDESTAYSHPRDIENIVEKAKSIEEKNKRAAQDYLEAVVGRLERNGTEFRAVALAGRVASELVDFVDDEDIDLVIIASHGRSGISRWVRGSIAERVLHSVRAPILIVRAE